MKQNKSNEPSNQPESGVEEGSFIAVCFQHPHQQVLYLAKLAAFEGGILSKGTSSIESRMQSEVLTNLYDPLQDGGQTQMTDHGGEHVTGKSLAEAVVIQDGVTLRLQHQLKQRKPELLQHFRFQS